VTSALYPEKDIDKVDSRWSIENVIENIKILFESSIAKSQSNETNVSVIFIFFCRTVEL